MYKIERFIDDSPRLLFSEGFEVIFYDNSSNIISTLKAENADVDEVNRIMRASNSVVLSNKTKKMYLTLALITIVLSAFFSGIEIAFVSSNKLQLELDKGSENISSKVIAFFSKNESNFITTILIKRKNTTAVG